MKPEKNMLIVTSWGELVDKEIIILILETFWTLNETEKKVVLNIIKQYPKKPE